jgi:hypothetical protein
VVPACWWKMTSLKVQQWWEEATHERRNRA